MFLMNPKTLKSKTLLHIKSYAFECIFFFFFFFFRILGSIKMKLGQIKVQIKTGICRFFLGSSEPFYDFDKMPNKYKMLIFSG